MYHTWHTHTHHTQLLSTLPRRLPQQIPGEPLLRVGPVFAAGFASQNLVHHLLRAEDGAPAGMVLKVRGKNIAVRLLVRGGPALSGRACAACMGYWLTHSACVRANASPEACRPAGTYHRANKRQAAQCRPTHVHAAPAHTSRLMRLRRRLAARAARSSACLHTRPRCTTTWTCWGGSAGRRLAACSLRWASARGRCGCVTM